MSTFQCPMKYTAKTISVTVSLVILLVAVGVFLMARAEPPPGVALSHRPPATAATVASHGGATTAPAGDPASALVASFYKALLQEEPPTRDQELALFAELSTVRARLVLGRRDEPDDEPMHRTQAYFQHRRQLEAKVVAAGPVVLTYLRNHKEWFIPYGRKPTNVSISSFWRIERNVEELKDPPPAGQGRGWGWVLALVTDTTDRGRVIRDRTVIFPIQGERIDVDGILLNGFGSTMVMEQVQKEP